MAQNATQLQGGGIPAGLSLAANRAYVRAPQRGETVEGRVTDLSKGTGAFLTGARNRGRTDAQRMGASNITAAANASEQAGLQAVLPIASQDAAAFSQAAGDNQNALNAFELKKLEHEEGLNNITSIANQMNGAAYHGAQTQSQLDERRFQHEREMSEAERRWRTGERIGTQEYGSEDREDVQGFETEQQREDRLFRRGEREGTQDYERGMTREDRDWRGNQAGLDREENRWARNFDAATAAQMGVLSTIMSDPAYFSDPDSAAGMMEFFANTWGRLSGRHLGGG